VYFERFTKGRLFLIPGTVKPWLSPAIAGGLPRVVTLKEKVRWRRTWNPELLNNLIMLLQFLTSRPWQF
jgi:hypothetical protein